MLKTFVDQSELLKYEPKLTDYLATGQSDFSVIINSAAEIFTQDLKANNVELKKICVPLVLHTSGSETTSKTGDVVEDTLERRLLYIDQTAVSGTSVFTLYGSNDKTTWTEAKTVNSNSIETVKVLFDDVYTYYRLDYSGTTSTYEAKLYEEVFQIAHIFLALSMIYKTLQNQADSVWEAKAVDYEDKYNRRLEKIIYGYDENLSGGIDAGETRMSRAGFTR